MNTEIFCSNLLSGCFADPIQAFTLIFTKGTKAVVNMNNSAISLEGLPLRLSEERSRLLLPKCILHEIGFPLSLF